MFRVDATGDERRLDALLNRSIPHSLEAEESLIGAMLLSKDAVAEAMEEVRADDFYSTSLQNVYKAIAALYLRGEAVDPVTVAEELKRSSSLDQVSGLAGLVELQASTPSIGNASQYAEIVRQYSLLRRLIKVAVEIADMAYGLPQDIFAVIDAAESKIFELAERPDADGIVPIKDSLSQALDRLESLYENDQPVSGTPTGFVDLDEIIYGLQPSNLIIVGARPGMGKTSFALSLAANAARVSSEPVLLFSLEMSHIELTERLVSAESRVDSSRIKSGKLTDQDWTKISHAIGRLSETKIFIDDNPDLTIMDIRSRARRLKAREGLSLVVIDYLQLMSGRRGAENRQVEVSEISRGLKILARQLDVPVVALSQLSRNLEARHDRRPQLADLRESGCVTADTIVTLANGESRTVSQLLVGDPTEAKLLSFDGQNLRPSQLAKVFFTGVRRVFTVSIDHPFFGHRSVRATSNHPFFTEDGWLPLEELKIGRKVAILADDSDTKVEWGTVSAITADSMEPTYDLTVEDTHCFFGNGVLLHNSLEQDADIVMFIYRDELYNPDSVDRGTAELIIAKHRNGPTGTARLAFLSHCTLFASMARMGDR